MKLKTILFVSFGIVITLFFYIERAILPPFIAAAIFAYLFSPVVDIISKKFHLPRGFSIAAIYIILLVIIVGIGFILSSRFAVETIDTTKVANVILENARQQAATLPGWLRPIIFDLLIALKKSSLFALVASPTSFLIANRAFSQVVNFFIFLFSSFYFLLDGEAFIQKVFTLISEKYRHDTAILLRDIHTIFSGYLRGQILLIGIMSLVHFITLSIVGVKFALTLAIFSGFAEIVPVIGPIIAGTVSVTMVLLTGGANFGLSPIQAAIIVAGLYFILRQLEDYMIIPHIMERIINLPPFFVFFAVVIGGHVGGMLGLILAVPVAAIIKLLGEFTLDKISAKKIS